MERKVCQQCGSDKVMVREVAYEGYVLKWDEKEKRYVFDDFESEVEDRWLRCGSCPYEYEYESESELVDTLMDAGAYKLAFEAQKL